MAICDWCKQEMTDEKTVSCKENTEVKFPDGTVLPAVRFFPRNLTPEQQKQVAWAHPEIVEKKLYSPSSSNRCHDCNTYIGGFHHPGCDNERCPKCHGQLISCGCLEE